MIDYAEWKVDVSEADLGPVRIERFGVSEEDASFHNLRCSFQPGGHARRIEPGEYTRMVRSGKWGSVVMSDTPAEIRDHLEPWRRAEGDVLLHGLGIGMVARMCLLKDEVRRVTVVEILPEVAEHVGGWLGDRFGDRVEIVVGDALTWRPEPGRQWDVVWHDIWDDICEDNRPAMNTLHRRFGRRSAWQGSWSRGWLDAFR